MRLLQSTALEDSLRVRPICWEKTLSLKMALAAADPGRKRAMGRTIERRARDPLSLLLAFGAIAFGGQSLQLTTQIISNTSVPAQKTGNPWRIEFSLHGWSASVTSNSHPLDASAVGVDVQFLDFAGGDIRLQIASLTAIGGSVCQIAGLGPGGPDGGSAFFTNRFITVRYEEDPVGKVDSCQAWDINGNQVWNQSNSYTANSGSNSSGAQVSGTGAGQTLDFAYFRIYTCTIPTNSRPPVTADTPACALVNWKFDGNLSDGSGNFYNGSNSGGTPAYVATPGQNLVVPVLQTVYAPAWTNAVSLRAGVPGQLTGAASYSQADGNATVSCFWQVLSGPSKVFWSDRNSCTPTVTGLIFGDYNFELQVTDVNGNVAIGSQDIGAVATDANGVVVNANPVVDTLLGNMIAWGQNPWGYQDYWAQHAATLRNADYAAPISVQNLTYPGWSTNGKPQWEVPGQGTVSYYFNGVGNLYFLNKTLGAALNGAITPASTSLVVNAASGIDLTSLPTRVVVYDGANWDELRICSAAGNTLNLCYDPSPLPRHSFASGTNVLQSKVTGTGTKFVTDPNSPLCPVGAPGLPGVPTYSAGTVSLTAGSTTMGISSGVWTGDGLNSVGVVVGGNFNANNFIQVSATHSGTPFTFMAQNTTGGAYPLPGLSGGAISAVTPGYGLIGNNYISGQAKVVIVDSTGSGAVVTPNIVGGQITSYTVVSGGSNYTNPTLFVSPTQVVLARPFPSDADTATGLTSYVMPATRTLVLHYKNLYTDPVYDPAGDSMQMFGATGCESDLAAYINPAGTSNSNGLGNQASGVHDTVLDGVYESGVSYSVTDSTGWVNQSSTGGINFYGEDIASRVLYLRSGLNLAKNAASVISNYWIHSPWGNTDGNGYPRLFLGGAAIGAWLSYLTDPNSLVKISNLRGYADIGRFFVCSEATSAVCSGVNPVGCNAYDDTRDTGYGYAFLILAAIYDPDTTSTAAPGGISWRAYWQGFLSQMQTNDTNCSNADYSWANGFLWNNGLPVLTLTNGSAIATGTGLPTSLCNGSASGSATVINGSNLITSTSGSFPGGTSPNLFLTGTTGGGTSVFVQSLIYSGSGSSATLGGYWLGDSGPVTWIAGDWDGNPGSGSAKDMMTIAMSNNDLTNLKKNWACTWNSSTQITLNRPWDGPSSDSTHVYRPGNGNLQGYGQQPFMLGIKSYGMNLLSTQTVPALSSYVAPYTTFTAGATSWIWNIGMDHQFFGTNYGRIYQQCEPVNTSPPGLNFSYRAPGCTYGPQYAFLSTEQNSETGAAHTIYYANNPSPSNLALGDEFYGSLWGFCPWTTGGVYCSAASTAANAAQSNLGDSSLNGGKWYGFFTGMGMSHRWPAARLGGVLPPVHRMVKIAVDLGAAGAASAQIVVTAPSGLKTTFPCSASPCSVTVDDRQGTHLYQIQYMSGAGKMLTQTDTDLLN